MELITPWALLFGLAAVVPVLLHLYQRRKRVVVLFSTNRFFTEAIHRAQRRLQLRRLLLLALRVAACLLLAFALAQPMLNLARLTPGQDGHRDLVILLDDSYSMQAADRDPAAAAPTSHFDQARKLALDALQRLAPGDRAAVTTFTGRTLGMTGSEPELISDPPRLVAELQALRPTFAAGDAWSALERAAAMLKKSEQRLRMLVVLSDFQAGDWRHSAWPQPLYAAATVLVQVGGPPRNNVLAESLQLSQGTPVAGQPALLHVRLVNGQPDTAVTELRLLIDNKEFERRKLSLAGGSVQQESIPVALPTAGEHRVQVQLSGSDALPADNTLYGILDVQRRLGVLLIDGQSGGTNDPSAAFFLHAALLATGSDRDGLQPVLIGPAALAKTRLENYASVILSNVKELPEAQVLRLEKFVADGGGLAIFLGDQADRTFYNQVLGGRKRPEGGLLPAEVGAVIAHDDRDASQSKHILEAEVSHPLLQRFDGPLRSALSTISIYRTYALAPREATVLASMENRLPLLVERPYGHGKVILCATLPQPGWCNLHQRRFFVPLVSRLASYLAGGGARGKVYDEVGQPIVLCSGKWDYLHPPHVIRPDRSAVDAAVKTVEADPIAYLPGEQVDQPGFYTLKAAGGAPLPGRQVLAVNVPRSESLGDALDLAHAKDQAGRWQVQAVSAAAAGENAHAAAIAALLERGQVHRGVWDVLILAALAVVLIEPLVANRFVRSSVESESTSLGRPLQAKKVA